MMKSSSSYPSWTSSYFQLLLLLLSSSLSSVVNAVLQGDEIYQDIDGGRFWAFHSGGISIVNVDTCDIEYDITSDSTGQPLPTQWLNGVYLEHNEKDDDDGLDSGGGGKTKSIHGYVMMLLSDDTNYYGLDNDDSNSGSNTQANGGGEILVMTTNPNYYDGGDGGGPVRWRVPLLIPHGGEEEEGTDNNNNNTNTNNHDNWRHNVYAVSKHNEFWTVGHGLLYILHLQKLTSDNELPNVVQPSHKMQFNDDVDQNHHHHRNNKHNKNNNNHHNNNHHNGPNNHHLHNGHHNSVTTTTPSPTPNPTPNPTTPNPTHSSNVANHHHIDGHTTIGEHHHTIGDHAIGNNIFESIKDYAANNGGGDSSSSSSSSGGGGERRNLIEQPGGDIATTTTTATTTTGVGSHSRYLNNNNNNNHHKKNNKRNNNNKNKKSTDSQFHGVLLWDEDEHLNGYGYISYGHDRAIHIVHMKNKEIVGSFKYAGHVAADECKGGDDIDGSGASSIHGIAYSSTNQHMYLECSPTSKHPGIVLEFNLHDPSSPVFVGKHNDVSGLLQEMNGIVMAINRFENKLHTLYPNANGEISSKQSSDYEVTIPGHPDKASLYIYEENNDGADDDEVDAVLCMPLTENVNRNNMDNNGHVVCDSYGGCGPPHSEMNVQDGMCLWDGDHNTDTETSNDGNITGKSLYRANIDIDYDDLQSEHGWYFKNDRCERCQDLDDFDFDGYCICTPNCGSCAQPDYDVSETGVACIQLSDVLNEKQHHVELIKGAGAVQQTPSLDDECGYNPAGTRRSNIRGGKYHVSIAHYPTNSLQVVDMSTQSLSCQVDLPGRPDYVVYVPPQNGQAHSSSKVQNGADSSSDKKNGGKVTLVVLASMIGLGAIYWFGIHGRHKYKPTPTITIKRTNLSIGADPSERQIPGVV